MIALLWVVYWAELIYSASHFQAEFLEIVIGKPVRSILQTVVSVEIDRYLMSSHTGHFLSSLHQSDTADIGRIDIYIDAL